MNDRHIKWGVFGGMDQWERIMGSEYDESILCIYMKNTMSPLKIV
jgi:hypothetical protein